MSATMSIRSFTRSKSPGIKRSNAEPLEHITRRRDATGPDVAFAHGDGAHFITVRHDLDRVLEAKEVVVRHEHHCSSAALRDDHVIHGVDIADELRPLSPHLRQRHRPDPPPLRYRAPQAAGMKRVVYVSRAYRSVMPAM